MIRAVSVGLSLVGLLFTIFGSAAADDAVEYQTILPVQHDAGKLTTVYTVTNVGNDAAAYSPGFYVYIRGTLMFPYRLVYQEASHALGKDAVETFSAAQFAANWTEPADTLIVNSSQPLSISHALKSLTPAAPLYLWLPMSANYVPGPAPGVSLVISEYKFVDEGQCYAYWIDREWVEVCDPDETRYSIYVKAPIAVSAMWMLRSDSADSGERVQMWRSAADEPGYVKFRPPMRGTTTYVPDKLEYKIGAEPFVDAYEPDCAWEEGEATPACWTFAIPD